MPSLRDIPKSLPEIPASLRVIPAKAGIHAAAIPRTPTHEGIGSTTIERAP